MYLNELPKVMISCLTITIFIEILISLIIGIRKRKDLINVLLVNIFTNPLVVSIPVLFNIKVGLMARHISLGILEIFTLLVEGFIYFKVLDYKHINPFLVALILNLASFLIGEVINYIF